MATLYTDGSFGEIKPMPEAFEEFQIAMDAGTARAFYTGTEEEVEQAKDNLDFKDRLDDLTNQLKDMKVNQNKILASPTLDDIERYSNG